MAKESPKRIGLPTGKLTKQTVIDNQLDYMTKVDYIEKYFPEARPETIASWMIQNKIHWFRPGRERLVIITAETLRVKPGPYGDRADYKD